MKYKNDEEIIDLIKNITDINVQQLNPDKDELVNLINKLQQKFTTQSLLYETQGLTDFNLSPLNEIDINLLVNKLPAYKIMCINKIKEKCGDNVYEEIKDEYNL